MIYDTSGTLGKPLDALSPAEAENLVLALIVQGLVDGAILDGKIYTLDNEKDEESKT